MISAILLSAATITPSAADNQDLVDTAAAAGQFGVLLEAASKAGLVGALRDADALTVLAPTDAAFAEVPPTLLQQLLLPSNQDSLAAVLTYHVIPGRRSASDLVQSREVKTLEGSTVRFSLENGRLRANGALVMNNDIEAANGTIHVIDQVLLPEGFRLTTPAASPTELIELAIERGAPLFNAGQQVACAAIYEITARSLLLLADDQICETAANAVRDALTKAEQQGNPAQQAWTLRYALDVAWREFEQHPTSASATPATPGWKTLFEFDESEADNVWFSVNDDVMGGVSRGEFEQASDSVSAFRGALSMENNGGFSTIRSPARDLDLAGYDGLILRVRGDGRTYSLSALKSDRRYEVQTWRQRFATASGEWQEIQIPFASLELSVMGRQFAGTRINPADIRSLSFSVSDKNEAPFRLEIDWIRAYEDGAALPADRLSP